MTCPKHPSEKITGICASCRSIFCRICAAFEAGQESELLCLGCGAAVAKRRLRKAMNFALLGLLLAMWLLPAPAQHAGRVPLAGLIGGYCSWATFWGWHANLPEWFNRPHTLLRRRWLGATLMLLGRVCLTTLGGIFWAGIKHPWQAIAVLRRWKTQA